MFGHFSTSGTEGLINWKSIDYFPCVQSGEPGKAGIAWNLKVVPGKLVIT